MRPLPAPAAGGPAGGEPPAGYCHP